MGKSFQTVIERISITLVLDVCVQAQGNKKSSFTFFLKKGKTDNDTNLMG